MHGSQSRWTLTSQGCSPCEAGNLAGRGERTSLVEKVVYGEVERMADPRSGMAAFRIQQLATILARSTLTPTSASCAQRGAMSSLGYMAARLCAGCWANRRGHVRIGVFYVLRCKFRRSWLAVVHTTWDVTYYMSPRQCSTNPARVPKGRTPYSVRTSPKFASMMNWGVGPS